MANFHQHSQFSRKIFPQDFKPITTIKTFPQAISILQRIFPQDLIPQVICENQVKNWLQE